MEPLDIWRGSFTRRWHTHPDLAVHDDPICGHQGRCALLVIVLWPDHSSELLRAAVTHDMGEFRVGDLPAWLKEEAGDLIEDHAAAEHRALAAMGLLVPLDDDDRVRLHLVDKLDAYLFARHRVPHVVNHPAWRAARMRIFEAAAQTGVWTAVESMVTV
ncbi:hypothetical protein [Loktanella sp. M215]|uniref:hypothetical protein n=1 Tax=Loktanella sp. M215 TaxID=2675431 RepID=UPI001F3CA064|nr:hypothetical protein [Loktanella sp. M215]MCF7700537.1 hypothetical protein [Loktanella sp. M215]